MQKNYQSAYMALGPVTALAGIFIQPLASTLLPLMLYFLFRKSRETAARVALQTADLAFSIQLWIVLASLGIMLAISMNWIDMQQSRQLMEQATLLLVVLFVISLTYALFKAFQGKTCRHWLSFRIAERVLYS